MAIRSPLTDQVLNTTKSSNRPKGQKIRYAIVHHWAGVGTGGIQRLVYSADKASANYIIADGKIIGSVGEEFRAWTSGSAAADNPAVTIEVQNSGGAPNWPVSAANIDALERLLADLADRYGWAVLDRSTVRGHREFAATACPGPFLWPRLGQIATAAQKRRGSKPVAKPVKPKPSAPKHKKIKEDAYWGKDTTLGLQTVLGMAVRDGVISSQSNHWRKRNPGLTSGWEWVTPGRAKGSLTILEHQKLLRKRGHYKGDLDGLAGPDYFRALQADMGTGRDGEIWAKSPAVKIMQKRINEGKI